MVQQGSEMRRFIRHPADVPIEIRPDAGPGAGAPRLSNVCKGGLCCTTDDPLDEGARVNVRIALVDPPFEARTQVVWCRPRQDRFEIGLCFLDPEDRFRARMVEQLCQIDHYRRRVRQSEGRDLAPEDAAQEWIAKYARGFDAQDG